MNTAGFAPLIECRNFLFGESASLGQDEWNTPYKAIAAVRRGEVLVKDESTLVDSIDALESQKK